MIVDPVDPVVTKLPRTHAGKNVNVMAEHMQCLGKLCYMGSKPPDRDRVQRLPFARLRLALNWKTLPIPGKAYRCIPPLQSHPDPPFGAAKPGLARKLQLASLHRLLKEPSTRLPVRHLHAFFALSRTRGCQFDCK